MQENFQLDSGVSVVARSMPHVASLSIGIYSMTGLHQESIACNGIAHFLEHMSFRGTKKRSSKQISEHMDRIGGIMNAYTTKEYTCYHATVLSDHIYTAIDILADLYINSTLTIPNMLATLTTLTTFATVT